MSNPSLSTKATEFYRILQACYGEPNWQAGEDAVDALIGTILSANTNDVNSGRAFDQLVATFDHDWDAIRTAPVERIIEAIRPAGMYRQKAPAIVAALEKIKQDWGHYTLDAVAEMPVADALRYLTAFVGVGNKTASIVLLFCFNRPAFPVDTHIQRISQRVGFCTRKANPDKIQLQWQSLLPGDQFYALHIMLIQHGRTLCKAQHPRCELCPAQMLCDYFQQRGEWESLKG